MVQFTTFSPPNNANEDDVHKPTEMSDVKCTVAKELMANGQGFLKDEDFMDEEERERVINGNKLLIVC